MINMDKAAIELIKCKSNPLYFIEEYCYVPITGGKMPAKSEQWMKVPHYRQFVRSVYTIKQVVLLFSRQLGKSTLIYLYALWAMTFYPGIQITFITIKKDLAIDTIKRLRAIHSWLPKWLQIPTQGGTGERKTYFELSNGSKFQTMYVSSATDPATLGRGLSVPIAIMDEAAFIRHVDKVWTGAQPAISKAKLQAEQSGYPTALIVSSTPNGVSGDGQFYYQMLQLMFYVNDLLDANDDWLPNKDEIIKAEGKNGFAKIVLKWDSLYDKEWYDEQVRQLNFNMRQVNQELDLVFLGSSNSIFDDDVILRLKAAPRNKVLLESGRALHYTRDLDTSHSFILGIDTSISTAPTADYCTIVVWDANEDYQVAEYRHRVPVLKQYSAGVVFIYEQLTYLGIDPDNIWLAIERNSFGAAIVEYLEYDERHDFNLFESQKGTDWISGIMTTKQTRDSMMSMLISKVNASPESINGALIIDEL